MTHLLQIALFMALCLLTGQNVFADPVQQLFEVEVSRGFSGPIELKDGRLLAVDRIGISGLISTTSYCFLSSVITDHCGEN